MSEPSESTSLRYAMSVIALAVFTTTCVAGFIVAFVYATDIFLLIFLAVLFGVFLSRCSWWLEDHSWLSYGWCLAVVTTLFLIGAVGTVYLFGAQVQSQVTKASEHLDEGKQKLRELADEYSLVDSILSSTPFVSSALQQQAPRKEKQQQSAGDASNPDNSQQEEDQPGSSDDASGERSQPDSTSESTFQSSSQSSSGLSALQPVAKRAVSVVGGVFKTTFGLVVNSLLIFFVGLFLAVSPGSYRDGVVRLFPRPRRERTREIMNEMGDTLWRWLIGRFGSMLVTGIGAGTLLAILGVPMAMSLGVVTALLTFIPNIGAAVALMLSVLFALPQGMTVVLVVVLGYLALQLIESYVVTPLIQQRQVSLPPALLISFQAIMGVLFGFLGAAVASPILAAAKVGIEQAYIKDALENGEDSAGS